MATSRLKAFVVNRLTGQLKQLKFSIQDSQTFDQSFEGDTYSPYSSGTRLEVFPQSSPTLF